MHDRVRKIVQEEGRSARNLIAYNVPAVDEAAAKPSKYGVLCYAVVVFIYSKSYQLIYLDG